MSRWPATIRVFLDFRMSCVGCPIAALPQRRRRLPRARDRPRRFLAALRAVAGCSGHVPAPAAVTRCHGLRRARTAYADRAARCAGGRSRSGPAAPRRSGAADGMQRGAGHLGDVLPADREIDLHALLHLAAGLPGEPQQRMGDAPLHLLRSTSRPRGYGSPAAGCRRSAACWWQAPDAAPPAAATRPTARPARRCHRPRSRSPDILVSPIAVRDAEDLARRDVAHHDLLARRRRLAGAHMAVQQHEEGMRILSLPRTPRCSSDSGPNAPRRGSRRVPPARDRRTAASSATSERSTAAMPVPSDADFGS